MDARIPIARREGLSTAKGPNLRPIALKYFVLNPVGNCLLLGRWRISAFELDLARIFGSELDDYISDVWSTGSGFLVANLIKNSLPRPSLS
jgi:hypothetical protein